MLYFGGENAYLGDALGLNDAVHPGYGGIKWMSRGRHIYIVFSDRGICSTLPLDRSIGHV